jgi:hypothetical protein
VHAADGQRPTGRRYGRTRWLRDIETQTGRLGIHREVFRDRRNATDPDVTFPVRWLLKARSFNVWMAGLAAFGLAALLVLAVTLAQPAWLEATG